MLEESGAKAVIDDNLDFFIGELESIDPKTPYDPEHGENRTIELSFPGLLNVMGVYLRDIYMQKHPGIEKTAETEVFPKKK
jgi:hypothetical protein